MMNIIRQANDVRICTNSAIFVTSELNISASIRNDKFHFMFFRFISYPYSTIRKPKPSSLFSVLSYMKHKKMATVVLIFLAASIRTTTRRKQIPFRKPTDHIDSNLIPLGV